MRMMATLQRRAAVKTGGEKGKGRWRDDDDDDDDNDDDDKDEDEDEDEDEELERQVFRPVVLLFRFFKLANFTEQWRDV